MGAFGGDSTPFCQNACPGLRVRDMWELLLLWPPLGPGMSLNHAPPPTPAKLLRPDPQPGSDSSACYSWGTEA